MIVLDTSALFHRDAIQALRVRTEPAVLPAVAFTERARQLERDGAATSAEFLEHLHTLGISVEAYSVGSSALATRIADDRMWARLARDALIAGHVHEGDELWTANVRDFVAVGLPRERIRDVRDFGEGER